MSAEVPKNEVRTVVHAVPAAGLFPLFELLHDNRNVVKIEHERAGANFTVTVHYAIMDLPLQLASVSAFVERCVAEVRTPDRVRS